MARYSRPVVEVGAQAQRNRDIAYAERQEAEREKERAKRQAEWDERDRLRAEQVARWDEEDARAAAEREAKFEADRLARTQEEARVLKDSLRARFLATAGSTPAQFEAVWPELLRQVQIDRTLAGQDAATQLKNELRQLYGSGAALFEARPRTD